MIEGKYGSGTTNTARCGIRQKKPIFCVPHGIYDPYGTGPNKIIQKGGILVTSAEDVLEYFEKNKKY